MLKEGFELVLGGEAEKKMVAKEIKKLKAKTEDEFIQDLFEMSIERLKKWIIVKWVYWVFSNPRPPDTIVSGEDYFYLSDFRKLPTCLHILRITPCILGI